MARGGATLDGECIGGVSTPSVHDDYAAPRFSWADRFCGGTGFPACRSHRRRAQLLGHAGDGAPALDGERTRVNPRSDRLVRQNASWAHAMIARDGARALDGEGPAPGSKRGLTGTLTYSRILAVPALLHVRACPFVLSSLHDIKLLQQTDAHLL